MSAVAYLLRDRPDACLDTSREPSLQDPLSLERKCHSSRASGPMGKVESKCSFSFLTLPCKAQMLSSVLRKTVKEFSMKFGHRRLFKTKWVL